jgi:thiamine-phosphate pyrophosphorylase
VKRLDESPYICLITPGQLDRSNFATERTTILDSIREAVDDGVNLIQIREKALPARLLYELVVAAVEISRSKRAKTIVNDRLDVAMAAGADGVHLPEKSFAPATVRSVCPGEFVVGVSTHSIDHALDSARAGADYVLFGPVYETPGKGSGVGVAALKTVCDALRPFPVIALGGIDHKNIGSAFAAGAAGIAAIRSLNDRDSRRSIREILNSGSVPMG